ncbi:MAG: protein-arginine deiminase family protein [Phycisphaerales bacterium]
MLTVFMGPTIARSLGAGALALAIAAPALIDAPAAAGCTPSCVGDLNGDGKVDGADLAILLEDWGTASPCSDIVVDGVIDGADLGILLRRWGDCPREETTIDLDVDTNRDNVIDDDDERDEEMWSRDRGAFYLVNCDDDDGDGKADAAEYDKDENVVVIDEVINNAMDEKDITPFIVRKLTNLANRAVYLKAANLDQIKAVHVFETIAAGEMKFWGGPNEIDDEVDITAMVSETDDTTFGLEGLKYRIDAGGVAGFTADMLFDGYIDLTLSVVDTTTGLEVGSDTVRLKVAPWLMLPNVQEADFVFAQEFSVPVVGGMAANDKFLQDIEDGLPAGTLETFTSDTQWAQDDIEIGYSQTPRSSARVAAYTRHHGSDEDPVLEGGQPVGDAAWRRELLMGMNALTDDVGIYRNPRGAADSGDYGGNLELLPPTTTHPLGRICHGDTMTEKKSQFLASQEVQEPFEIVTSWLSVGHVDEFVAFWKETPLTVVLASPRLAYDTLGYGAGFPAPPAFAPGGGDTGGGDGGVAGAAPPDFATFFSVGLNDDGVAEGFAPGLAMTTLTDVDKNFLDPGAPVWQFVRIYDGTGAGQIAHIAGYLDPTTLVIDTVWSEFPMTDPASFSLGSTLPPSAAPINSIGFSTMVSGTWMQPLDSTSKYVLVQDTLWWNSPGNFDADALAGPVFPLNKTPATITRKEFDPAKPNGKKMKDLNIAAQELIDDARTAIKAAAAPDAVTFIEVPVLYTGRLDAAGDIVDRSAVAWTPGAANILFANGNLFIAAQKGPRWRNPATGLMTEHFEDVIDNTITAAGGNVVFVEDWDHYHALSGEVHCGTNALREIYAFPWWEHAP